MNLKTLATAIIIALSFNSYAQNNWYVKASAGIGSSNINAKSITIGKLVIPKDYTPIRGYTALATVGLRSKHIDISTGLQFLSTGNKEQLLFVSSGSSVMFDTGYMVNRYSHILVPIQIGYIIHAYRGLSLVPQIGADICYTGFLTHYLTSSYGTTKQQRKLDGSSAQQRFNIYSHFRLNVEYAVTKKFSLSIAPSVYYMATRFEKAPANEHPYFIGGEFGGIINLGKGHPHQAKAAPEQVQD